MEVFKEKIVLEKIDFDQYAQDYEKILHGQLKFFEGDTDYFAGYKVQLMREQARIKPQNVLEYGCGTGRNLKFLLRTFPDADIYGCDISTKSLEVAAKNAPAARLFQNTPIDTDRYTQCFDLIFLAGVIHHIPPAMRAQSLSILVRWLKPGGEIFIFEHNPYNPLSRHLVNTCPYDKDAVLLKPKELQSLCLAGGLEILAVKYTLFFPSFLKGLRSLERKLTRCPLGGQYYIQMVKPT